jgi:hypothetical protein
MHTGYQCAIDSATSQKAYCNRTSEGMRLHTHRLHDFRMPSVSLVCQSADTRHTLHMLKIATHSSSSIYEANTLQLLALAVDHSD